jgi:hypothetical protein
VGSSNLLLYIDGALSRTAAGNSSFIINTVGQAYSGIPYAFKGILDDVRVYDGALDSAAILALYRMRTNAPPQINTAPGVTRLHVVLQGGQSNADGRADPAGLPTSPANLQQPQTNIHFYYRAPGGADTLTTLRPGTSGSSEFGPEVTCGAGYQDLVVMDASTRVAIVKYARGGTSLLSDWKPGGDGTAAGDGDDYVTFQQTVSVGMAALAALYTNAAITIDGMTWMQGESDASSASTYRTNLAAFIADVRATIRADLPFVIGRLSTGQTAIAAAELAVLRAAQEDVAAADPWTGLVDTDMCPIQSSDRLHFDAAGQQMLGYAFAFQLFYLQGLTNRFAPDHIATGAAEPAADPDGDGADNRAEFIAGTDPTNAASALAADLRIADGVLSVVYPTAAGRRYDVESRPDHAESAWMPALPAEAGTGDPSLRALTNDAPVDVIRIRATLP